MSHTDIQGIDTSDLYSAVAHGDTWILNAKRSGSVRPIRR